jgi:beta-phosphoglucomutase-like phosphatase (HAD superfamily)
MELHQVNARGGGVALKTGGNATKSRFELIIFDCDGVLVDSESITNKIFSGMLNELGIFVSDEDMFERFVGRSMPQCLEVIEALSGRAVPAGFVEDYYARSTRALKSDLKAVADIGLVLDSVGVPYCVASSGTHDKMNTTLGITGLLSKFRGRMYSVTEVANSKPAPDVFLHAAKQSGVPAAACAVIEDTPTGVRAGVAAEMTVFGYCAVTPQKRLIEAGAHYTFERMRDLPALLFSPR